MRLDLTYLDNEKGTMVFSLCFPSICLSKTIRPEIGEELNQTNVEFNTKFSVQSSKNMLDLEILILGFGIRLYIKEKL
jgi:hypothetical protein